MLLGASKAPDWLAMASEGEGDVYLTDGMRLFRLVETVVIGESRCARLEDCHTLRETLHTKDELWRLQLRMVRRAAPA